MDQSGKKSKYCIHFKFLPVTDFRSRICSMLSCWVLFLCCGLKLSSMFLCWINIFCATLAIKSARWVWSAWIKATFLLDGDNDGVISNGAHPPRNALHPPPVAFGTAQKSFCTPSNYTYFDLIFSYLVILITKFVKLLILWSQMPPCRPRKQVLLNIFLGLSGCCHQASAKANSSTPPQIFIHTRGGGPRTKIWKSVSVFK